MKFGVKGKAPLHGDFFVGLRLREGRVYWAGEYVPRPWDRYLSQGRGLLRSKGTTWWVLLPANKHMARRVSSFVLGSSCELSRSRIPSTISSIYREEPQESQGLLPCLPSSSLAINSQTQEATCNPASDSLLKAEF